MSTNRIKQQPVYLQSGDPESENNASLYIPGDLGKVFTVKQPSRSTPGVEAGRPKGYQVIRTDSTMTVAPYPGATAWWSDRAKSMVTTSATNRNQIAGVFQNAITPGYFGCIQKYGPATTKVLDADVASLAIGDSIIPSATNGKATRVAVGTAPTHALMGRVGGPSISTDVLNATVVVDLDIPD